VTRPSSVVSSTNAHTNGAPLCSLTRSQSASSWYEPSASQISATLPEHRAKGGQSALLAERIRHARAIGCDVLVTETGERREDLPSNSYRNIIRAGFTEVSVRANWLRPARVTRTP